MKFTGIVASLAVASNASALAVPNQVQGAITQLETVLGSVTTVVDGLLNPVTGTVTGTTSQAVAPIDLKSIQSKLQTIHTDLSGLLGKNVCDTASSNGVGSGVESEVSSLATGVVSEVTSVVSTLGLTGEVSSLEALAAKLVGGIQGNAIDADGLTSILQVIGMNNGLANLNGVLANVQ